MSYGLIYTIPFASLDNVPCLVEIEKEDYTGVAIELVGGDRPFSVDIEDSDFLYTPTRFSTGKLSVVGSDYLQELFSTEYRKYRVTFKKNGIINWCGFIKPELYTQPYSSEIFTLEIECISAMSVLEFIDYKVVGEGKSFISLWDLLKRCLFECRGNYTSVYIPYVYASSKQAYETLENVIEGMLVSEQNFFDEDGKPMRFKEILEEICKFLNWTCVDWKGDLYFVDVDHTGVYQEYNLSLTSFTKAYFNEVNIQDIGFTGAGHALDILPGYNKAVIRCSNYPINMAIPELFDSALLSTLIKQYPFYKKIDGDKYSYFIKFYTNSRFNNIFSDKDSIAPIGIDLESLAENADSSIINNIGSLISKQAKYKWIDGTPSTLNFEDILIIGMGLINKNYTLLDDLTFFLIKDIPVLQINPDYLIDTIVSPPDETTTTYILLSGQYFQSDTLYTNPFQEGDGKWNNVSGDNCCKFKLKVGNKYWNGGSWVEEDSRFIIKCGGRDKSKVWYEWNSFENNVTYDMNLDSEGYAIPVRKKDKLFGKIEFTVLRPMPNSYGEGGRIKRYPYYTFMRNLELKLFTVSEILKEEDNSDRTYENVLNEDYINELDEIEFKISSFNNDGACYSKIMLNGDYLTDNLYNCILDETIRPEELLITRLVNHYRATKIKLTQVIKNVDELTPLTRLSDKFQVDKKFINAGGSIDYKADRFNCIMIEV